MYLVFGKKQMKQSEILKLIKSEGTYSAKLYRFCRSVRGLREVRPAQKLTEKGFLRMVSEEKEKNEFGEVVTYVWALATNNDIKAEGNGGGD